MAYWSLGTSSLSQSLFVHLPTHINTMASIANVRAFQVTCLYQQHFSLPFSRRTGPSRGHGGLLELVVVSPTSCSRSTSVHSQPRQLMQRGILHEGVKRTQTNPSLYFFYCHFVGCSRLLHCLQRQGSETKQDTGRATEPTFTQMSTMEAIDIYFSY